MKAFTVLETISMIAAIPYYKVRNAHLKKKIQKIKMVEARARLYDK